MKIPFLPFFGSSAVVVGGAAVSTITGDPQYAQAGIGVAAAGKTGEILSSVGLGVIANYIYKAFTDDSLETGDLLENHDLRRLLGNALADCVKESIKDCDSGDRESLQKLVEIIPVGWQAIANHPMLEEEAQPIKESQLVELISIGFGSSDRSESEKQESVEPVLSAEQCQKILKSIANLKDPDFKFNDSAFKHASNQVEKHFLPMLVEVTKRDFANDGEAYAALHLRMLSEILQGQEKFVKTSDFSKELDIQLGRSTKSFSIVAKKYSDRISAHLDKGFTELKEQSQNQYREIVRRLDAVQGGINQLDTDSGDCRPTSNEPVKESVPFDPPLAAVNTFYGRVKERNQLVKYLLEGRNCSVVGQAGFGKTALAASAIEIVIRERGGDLASSPFPDGVINLDLYKSGCDLGSLFGKLADLLEPTRIAENETARERAEAACHGKKILVVIEGAELADGKNGRPDLKDLLSVLSKENCRLVLTRDVEQVGPNYRVKLDQKLGETHAKQLFNKLTENKIGGPVRDRILELLDGHPLAITWAGGLLNDENEDASILADQWQLDPTLTLKDRDNAKHTLKWLFERSLLGLDDLTKKVLSAAGMLGRDVFSITALQSAFPDEEHSSVRDAIKRLIDRGFIRLTKIDNCRDFTHVLGYQFARSQKDAEDSVRERLASWLLSKIQDSTEDGLNVPGVDLQRHLHHASALIKSDSNLVLWMPLIFYLLYEGWDRLMVVGRVEWVRIGLDSVSEWLHRISGQNSQPTWMREQSVSLDRLGDLSIAEGDLAGARKLFSDGLEVAKRLSESDPGNAGWQRDLVVSYSKLADLETRLENEINATKFNSKCFVIMKQMKENQMHFDPALEKHYQSLSEKSGKE